MNQMGEQEFGGLIGLCKTCFDQQCVASFFCDISNPEKHLTGFVAGYCEEELLIKHISPDGFYDGFVLVCMSDIVRIDVSGEYEQRIARLYSIRKQSHPNLGHMHEAFYPTIMEFAYQNKLIVSVEWENAIISGFILEYDEHHIHLRVIDDNGRNDGETIVLVKCVLSFAVDTTTEQNIRLLWLEGEALSSNG